MNSIFSGDPRLPHWSFPPKKLNPDELTKLTGTIYYKLDMDDSIALSKRIAIMKIERLIVLMKCFPTLNYRKFKREDTYTLDDVATIDFKDKVNSWPSKIIYMQSSR